MSTFENKYQKHIEACFREQDDYMIVIKAVVTELCIMYTVVYRTLNYAWKSLFLWDSTLDNIDSKVHFDSTPNIRKSSQNNNLGFTNGK